MSKPRPVIGLSRLSGSDENTDGTSADEALSVLAYRVERLTPHHGKPERFHEDKSEIVAELHRLAHVVRHG